MEKLLFLLSFILLFSLFISTESCTSRSGKRLAATHLVSATTIDSPAADLSVPLWYQVMYEDGMVKWILNPEKVDAAPGDKLIVHEWETMAMPAPRKEIYGFYIDSIGMPKDYADTTAYIKFDRVTVIK